MASVFRSSHERLAMKLRYDPEADAAYLKLDDAPVVESEEVRPGVVLDFDGRDRVVGIEILNVRRTFPTAEIVASGMASGE